MGINAFNFYQYLLQDSIETLTTFLNTFTLSEITHIDVVYKIYLQNKASISSDANKSHW